MTPTTPPTSDTARAESRAREALRALEEGRARDAGWLTLHALEADERSGLAWAVVSRLIVDLTQDPLGTLAGRHALELGVPEPERTLVERHHRIDLWTRGLVRAEGGAAILHATDLDDAAKLADTPEKARWIDEQLILAEGPARAMRAARRMVAAFADAWDVPEVGDANPLYEDAPWPERAEYTEWKATRREEVIEPAAVSAPTQLTVLSDHWMEVEVASLAAEGHLDASLERANLWIHLRPHKLRPRAALLRLQHAAGLEADRDATAKVMITLGSRDLNELEEARVALGELRLWSAQLEILDQMEELAPSHPVILANRGVALLELGRRAEGATNLERALDLDPTYGPALANLGLERMRQDEYVAARELLERAVLVAPDQPQARLYLAACKNNQGDRAGALADLERVLELDPGNTEAKTLLEDLKSHELRRR